MSPVLPDSEGKVSHVEAVIPPEERLRTVGRCIWCGRSPPEVALRDEHPIPFSFGGHRTLGDACCLDCQNDQAAYIGHCCDKMLRAMRLHHKLPSRKKSKKTISVMTAKGGIQDYAEIDASKAPGVVMLPVLDIPGLLGGPERAENDFPMTGLYFSNTTDDARERQLALQAEGIPRALSTASTPTTQFARVLAHIGHAYFLSDRDREQESLLLPIARGDLRNLHRVIGGMPPGAPILPDPRPGAGIHQIQPANARANGEDYVIANIRLFTHLRPLPPIYTVVLCRRPIPKGEDYLSFERDKVTNALNIESAVMG